MLHSFYPHRSPALPRLDLSQRRRGEHGSQSRRQPRQPHDSGDCLLPEEPEEDDVLPGLQEQTVPALRHLPPQRDLRQAGQHVSNSLKGSACHVSSHGLLIVFCCCCFFTDTWNWSTQTVTLNQRRASSSSSQTPGAPDWPGCSSERTLSVTETWKPSKNRWEATRW